MAPSGVFEQYCISLGLIRSRTWWYPSLVFSFAFQNRKTNRLFKMCVAVWSLHNHDVSCCRQVVVGRSWDVLTVYSMPMDFEKLDNGVYLDPKCM